MNRAAAFMNYTGENCNTPLSELFKKSGSGVKIGDTSPENPNVLWIDTSNSENILKYFHPDKNIWTEVKISGTGIPPQAMISVSGKYDTDIGRYKLTFTEAPDTIVEGQVLCSISKIVIVRKKDSEPTGILDGDVLATIYRDSFGSYKTNPLIDDTLVAEPGDIYYYKVFPISEGGICNTSSENSTGPIECVEAPEYELYGFTINPNESDPASMISYIGDNESFTPAKMNFTSGEFEYGSWENAWFIKDLNPCMLNYDGTIAYSLDKNDYTKKADGTTSDVGNTSFAGNAMVGIPKVYTKIVNNDNGTISVYFSDVKIDDKFNCYAHIDSDGNEMDYTYMPIYNGSNVSNRMRSISGLTVSNNTTVDTEITYAKANNLNSDTIWHTEVLSDRMLINLLLVLIGKSTDSQTVFGSGNTNGYVDSSNYGLLTTGTMNKKGLFWGNQDTKSGVKIFGMENWWGNIHRRIAGWICSKGTHKIKLTRGTYDGSTTEGYNTTGDGYIPVYGSTRASSGYIEKMLAYKFGLFPKEVGGSTTTYYPDYFYANVSAGPNYAYVGGSSAYGLDCGPWSSILSDSVSYSVWGIGASISCKPLAQKG